jgi:DNA-binding GntR family transcriptional regulator
MPESPAGGEGRGASSFELLSDRQRVSDDVHRLLRRAIFTRELPPGARLSVPALATRFGLSRSPIREAVLRLVREGLADEVPYRGAVVRRVGAEEIAPLYELREVLEGLAARLAATRASPDALSELRSTVAEHAEVIAAGDVAAHFEVDMRFHRLVREAAGNDQLVGALEPVQDRIRIAMLTTSLTAGPAQALRDHETILRAIEARDPEAAEAAARQHIRRLVAHLADTAAAGGEPGA